MSDGGGVVPVLYLDVHAVHRLEIDAPTCGPWTKVDGP